MIVGCSRTVTGPLSFQPPTDWNVKHDALAGLDFYTVTAKTPGEGLLMFSRWVPPSRPDEVPALVQKLADGFREQAKKSSEFALVSNEYRVERFAGEYCQGNFALFQTASGGTNTVVVMFMMSVDGKVWNGQFTGSPDAWTRALTAIKSLKNAG